MREEIGTDSLLSNGTAPTLSSLAADLREFALLYRSGGLAALSNAASILDDISLLVESGKATKPVLDEAYRKLTDAVWKDFLAVAYGKDILDDVDAILRIPSPTMMDAVNLMQSSRTPTRTCSQIIKLSNRLLERETNIQVTMHLLCFAYLLLLEGTYDNTLRFLYAHFLRLSNTRADIVEIKNRFDKAQVGRSLFEGWNRTVRNAIAHATYSLDTSSGMIEFEDQQSGRKEHLTLHDFTALVGRTYDVVVAVWVLLILRIFVPSTLSESLKLSRNA